LVVFDYSDPQPDEFFDAENFAVEVKERRLRDVRDIYRAGQKPVGQKPRSRSQIHDLQGYRAPKLIEILTNRNGDLKIAKQLIDVASAAGCDYVKFQKRTVELVYTEEELEFARRIGETVPVEQKRDALRKRELPDWEKYIDVDLMTDILDPWDEGQAGGGSTDVADISWKTPTMEFSTAAAVLGTPGHSWHFVATSGMSIGHKSLIFAVLITIVSVVDGISVKGGAEGVGRVTTSAVVHGISAIVLTDMIFVFMTTS